MTASNPYTIYSPLDSSPRSASRDELNRFSSPETDLRNDETFKESALNCHFDPRSVAFNVRQFPSINSSLSMNYEIFIFPPSNRKGIILSPTESLTKIARRFFESDPSNYPPRNSSRAASSNDQALINNNKTPSQTVTPIPVPANGRHSALSDEEASSQNPPRSLSSRSLSTSTTLIDDWDLPNDQTSSQTVTPKSVLSDEEVSSSNSSPLLPSSSTRTMRPSDKRFDKFFNYLNEDVQDLAMANDGLEEILRRYHNLQNQLAEHYQYKCSINIRNQQKFRMLEEAISRINRQYQQETQKLNKLEFAVNVLRSRNTQLLQKIVKSRRNAKNNGELLTIIQNQKDTIQALEEQLKAAQKTQNVAEVATQTSQERKVISTSDAETSTAVAMINCGAQAPEEEEPPELPVVKPLTIESPIPVIVKSPTPEIAPPEENPIDISLEESPMSTENKAFYLQSFTDLLSKTQKEIYNKLLKNAEKLSHISRIQYAAYNHYRTKKTAVPFANRPPIQGPFIYTCDPTNSLENIEPTTLKDIESHLRGRGRETDATALIGALENGYYPITGHIISAFCCLFNKDDRLHDKTYFKLQDVSQKQQRRDILHMACFFVAHTESNIKQLSKEDFIQHVKKLADCYSCEMGESAISSRPNFDKEIRDRYRICKVQGRPFMQELIEMRTLLENSKHVPEFLTQAKNYIDGNLKGLQSVLQKIVEQKNLAI